MQTRFPLKNHEVTFYLTSTVPTIAVLLGRREDRHGRPGEAAAREGPPLHEEEEGREGPEQGEGERQGQGQGRVVARWL